MNFLINNWQAIACIIVAAGAISWAVFTGQKECLTSWLNGAVVAAETALGSNAGQAKLQLVYDAALTKFPMVMTFITFEQFSGYVDTALDLVKDKIDSISNSSTEG